MSIVVEMKKGSAETVCNALRQTALCRRKVLRPIAVKVGEQSSVVAMGPLVLEDMTEFISKLVSYNYLPVGDLAEGDLIPVTVSCTGKVTLGDILGDVATAYNASNNDELLHFVKSSSGDTVIQVDVYFRYACGSFSSQQNEDFLDMHKIDVSSGITCFNSRHNDIESFAFDVNKTGTADDQATISIKSKIAVSEQQILKESINDLVQSLNTLNDNI